MTVRSLLVSAQRKWFVRGAVSLGSNVHLGPGSYLWAAQGLRLDDDVYVGKWCTVEVDGHIGAGTMIANNVGIIGRRDHDISAVGSSVRHAPWVGDHPELAAAVDIGPDVWIGFGAIVLAPVIIGRGAVVGAGAVVTRDVEPYAVVAGNPARQIGQRFTPAQQVEHEARLYGSAVPAQRPAPAEAHDAAVAGR